MGIDSAPQKLVNEWENLYDFFLHYWGFHALQKKHLSDWAQIWQVNYSRNLP